MNFLCVEMFFFNACATDTESTSSASNELAFIQLQDTCRVGATKDGGKGGFGRLVTIIRELQGWYIVLESIAPDQAHPAQ